jgi:hypothetical protein
MFYLKTQFVPRSKCYLTVTKTNQLMLYGGKGAVCPKSHAKHIHCAGST